MTDLATIAREIGPGNGLALMLAGAVVALWRENRRLYGLLMRAAPRRVRRRK